MKLPELQSVFGRPLLLALELDSDQIIATAFSFRRDVLTPKLLQKYPVHSDSLEVTLQNLVKKYPQWQHAELILVVPELTVLFLHTANAENEKFRYDALNTQEYIIAVNDGAQNNAVQAVARTAQVSQWLNVVNRAGLHPIAIVKGLSEAPIACLAAFPDLAEIKSGYAVVEQDRLYLLFFEQSFFLDISQLNLPMEAEKIELSVRQQLQKLTGDDNPQDQPLHWVIERHGSNGAAKVCRKLCLQQKMAKSPEWLNDDYISTSGAIIGRQTGSPAFFDFLSADARQQIRRHLLQRILMRYFFGFIIFHFMIALVWLISSWVEQDVSMSSTTIIRQMTELEKLNNIYTQALAERDRTRGLLSGLTMRGKMLADVARAVPDELVFTAIKCETGKDCYFILDGFSHGHSQVILYLQRLESVFSPEAVELVLLENVKTAAPWTKWPGPSHFRIKINR